MKIGSIMWGSSQIISLVEAANSVDFVELKLWSMNDLEEEDRKAQCLKTLKNQDILFLYPSNNSVWEEIEPQIKKIGQFVPIICLSSDLTLLSISTVAKKVVITCQQYLTFGGTENLCNMLNFIGKELFGLKIEVEPPKEIAWEGIYHPDAPGIFKNIKDYLNWYPHRKGPTAGILFYRSYWVNKNLEVEDALIRGLERESLNVLAVFSHSAGKTDFNSKTSYGVVKEFFFDKKDKPRIDALVNLQSFLLGSESKEKDSQIDRVNQGIELLTKLDVPVFHPIVSYYKSEEEWRKDHHGIGGSVGWSVAMPEFEGVIEPIIIGAVKRESEPTTGITLIRYAPIKERVEKAVKRIRNWIALKEKKPSERKIAFILNNPACVGVELSVGSGSKLDTLESVVRIMRQMKKSGYQIENLPENGKELITTIMEKKAISEFRWTTVDEIIKKGGALALLDKEEYIKWFDTFPQNARERISESWGEPPGEEKDGVPAAMVYNGKIVITGVQYGNVVICCQPKRGCAGSRCDGRVCKILHDPEIPPPHQYLATYRYLEKKFAADVLINVGTHGSQEFLPGKSVGLSASCYPDLAIDNLPYLYIYNSDNPPEGTIAKRRGPATLVDHMQTVMTESRLYGHLEKLEDYLGEYAQAKDFDPARKNILKEQILDTIREAKLEKELKLKENLPFEKIVSRSHEIITKIRDTQIPDGMHIFGEYPKNKRKVEFIHSILRYDFGDGISSRRILFNLIDEDLDFAMKNPSSISLKHKKTYGELIKNVDIFSKKLIEQFLKNDKSPEVLAKQTLKEYLKNSESIELLSALREKVIDIAKRIDSSKEIESLFHGFKGGYIQPGPSGLITRGRPDVLPTGRNFYSLDPEKIPTRAAWKVGVRMADALIERHKEKTGKFPENLAMVWFSSDIMHADGEEMSQLLYLIGTRPVWQDNGKVKGFEIIPLKELKRPRIDITIRVSGITRDCFPRCIELLDEAIQAVATLSESIEHNFIRKHVLEQMNASGKDEISKEDWRDATLRLFTSRPGTYGSGVNLAIYASAWKEEKDLSETFIYWNGYAYGKGVYGKESHQRLIKQLSSVDLTFNKTCTDESDLFSCCCYFSVQGGMAAAARHISGKEIENYYGDTRNPSHLKVTDLADEIRRVVRTKVLNPKWIDGMKRHGYKGAGDISKRIGRVYGWQATTGEVDDWIFDEIAKTFVLDEEMRKFFEENNPWALEEIGRRLLEAHQRELWDADPKVLQALKDIYLEIESWLEERMGDVKGDFQGGSIDILTSSDVENWNSNVKQIQKLIERQK